MNDRQVDAMVTGTESVDDLAVRALWAYALACFIYAGVIGLGLALLFLIA